jgi:dihydroxyacetone kinase-like protein
MLERKEWTMKKIMNEPLAFVDEMMQGILKAHPDDLKAVGGDLRAIVRADAPVKGKVAIATGGGSGHLPVFMGYIGKGLVDGASIGNVFSSPTTGQMLKVTKAVSGGAGVLYLYGRYQGDMMNFDMAAEMAADDDIRVETLLVSDDVASAPPGEWQKRRGVAGLFFAYKIAGAKAQEGVNLDEVKASTEKALATIRSMGVALGPCTVPAVGKPTFTIGVNEMEIGMGIHGEAGVHRGPMKSADEIAEILVDAVVKDLPYRAGDEVSVLVNSLGGTPLEELYILYRKVAPLLENKGISIYRPYVGRYACSMEMLGASLTLMRLDAELKRLLDAPAHTPFFCQA